MRIINTQGEIKRGKLANAAYQLKDGQQMRRVIEKKGGITSKSQNKQRSLFRLALAFKKTLTPEDKRNLESIAYKYHFRNQDGIIYDWHMLAMKLALTRPTITCTKLN